MKTIIFDLGGVYFSDGANIFIVLLEKQFGITREQARNVIGGEMGIKYRTGKISPNEFWLFATSKWNIDDKNLSELWISCYEPLKETVKLIKKLKANGYELLFLSDSVPDREKFLQSKYNFKDNFTDGVFSFMVGATKPNKIMYEAVLAKTKSTPNECLYIDDKETNLPQAKQLGMHALHFKGPKQLESELEGLGITL